MKTDVLSVRAVQLDLARQMETVAFIRGFADRMAGFGYNALVLYLEGRVRTPTFPYPSRDESYTPEEMKAVVEHAAKRGMDVIPVVSTLGHVEQFLRHKKLRELAELREGIPGRFGDALTSFCPSREETYRFLESYLAEIATIFPSPYCHAGCDEVWDFALCPDCQKRMRHGETGSDIFARHLIRTHDIVTGRLGKRMIVWDDMLEMYPEALEKLPRDIVMCVWQYDSLADATRNHFGPRQSDRRLDDYRRLGFDYWIAPWEHTARNAATLTEYALPFKPTGGLLTTWERSDSLLLDDYPNLAFAGRLWEKRAAGSVETDERIFKQANAELMGNVDERFLQALWLAKNLGNWPRAIPAEPVCRGALSPYLFERDNALAILIDLLEEGERKVKGETGAAVLADLLGKLRHERLQHALQVWTNRLHLRLSGGSHEPLPGLVAEGRAIQARHRKLMDAELTLADRIRSPELTKPLRVMWENSRIGL
ncbi:MAG: family 20 glycosylhydrolase, partial [Kiritimatiellae bacterium]|nr:family 20 glycosylhydrolase [Kiritimatiellia bacterium]